MSSISPQKQQESSLKKARISVIVPHFNGGRKIIDAIQSILSQDPAPFEILVVDDYSQETNAHLFKAATELGVRVIQLSKNSGQSAARNIGVKHAKGDWVCFLDQDDTYMPNHNATLLDGVAQFPDIQAVFGGFLVPKQRPGGDKAMAPPRFKRLNPEKTLGSVWKGLTIVPGAMLLHRETFLEHGGFDEELRGFEDEDLVVRLLLNGYSCAITNTPVLVWRQSLASASYQLTFLDSRMLYLKKIQMQLGSTRVWAAQLSKMRFRFELLTCWDLLSLGLTHKDIRIATLKFDEIGIKPLFAFSPLEKLASLQESSRGRLRRLFSSAPVRALLKILGLVKSRNAIRLGLARRLGE